MQIVPVEVDIRVLGFNVVEELALFVVLVVVRLDCALPLFNLHQFKLLPLQFLRCLVNGRVPVAAMLRIVRFFEEFLHSFAHRIVYVIYHVVELTLPLKILHRRALLPLEIAIIKIIVQNALIMLRDVLHFVHVCAGLVIARIKTRIKLINNRIDNLGWMP